MPLFRYNRAMIPREASGPLFTYADYRSWIGDERWELIDGEAFAMSPAPLRLHQQVVTRLCSQLDAALENHPCQVYVAPFDVRLPRGGESDDRIDTVVQPDLAVICDATKLDDAGCRGAPDFIVEVLSKSTSARDLVQKRELYARHGVREYWIVDAEARILERCLLRFAGQPYPAAEKSAARGRTAIQTLPGLAIDWHRVFGD